jgi:hypothetical protein
MYIKFYLFEWVNTSINKAELNNTKLVSCFPPLNLCYKNHYINGVTRKQSLFIQRIKLKQQVIAMFKLYLKFLTTVLSEIDLFYVIQMLTYGLLLIIWCDML